MMACDMYGRIVSVGVDAPFSAFVMHHREECTSLEQR